jgi:hypothetical protein
MFIRRSRKLLARSAFVAAALGAVLLAAAHASHFEGAFEAAGTVLAMVALSIVWVVAYGAARSDNVHNLVSAPQWAHEISLDDPAESVAARPTWPPTQRGDHCGPPNRARLL